MNVKAMEIGIYSLVTNGHTLWSDESTSNCSNEASEILSQKKPFRFEECSQSPILGQPSSSSTPTKRSFQQHRGRIEMIYTIELF